MKSELHKKIREENYAIRFLVYIVGLFIMTLGISLSVKSNLGVSPVSSIPSPVSQGLKWERQRYFFISCWL